MANFEFLDKSGLELLVRKFNAKLEANAKNDAAIADAVLECFNKVEYIKEDKKIYFYNGENKLGTIDAADFVKDGMIETVEVKDGKLVITFNQDGKAEPIELALTEIFDVDNYYTITEVDAELAKKQDVGDYVEYVDLGGKKAIKFDLDDQILGADSSNMLQMRKYASVPVNCVEVGSKTTGLILNSVEGLIAIDGGEKQEFVATKSDIEKANEDVVKYTPFNYNGVERKTIVLAEGDTISSLGVNFGTVKTYPSFNNGETPVLEVGGSKGALVLNTCEDVVKVEVVEEGKRVQHAIATVDDFKPIEASYIETLFAEPEVKE